MWCMWNHFGWWIELEADLVVRSWEPDVAENQRAGFCGDIAQVYLGSLVSKIREYQLAVAVVGLGEVVHLTSLTH